MAITIKEETILDQWSAILDGAAGSNHQLLEDIRQRLAAAQIPGECTWEFEEIKSAGWLSKVRREFLVIRWKQFSDYRLYIGVRDFGVNLDVCRFLTIEPGAFKKFLSRNVAGDDAALSGPKNILVAQDLRAWLTTVHHVLLNSVDQLLAELGQDSSGIERKSKGMLEVW